MPEVLMPRLSDATTEATIVAWLVPDGTVVRAGDEVVEIETDKATTAWPADADGVLSIEVPAGRTVCPGTAIAQIGAAATHPAASNGAGSSAGASKEAASDGAAPNGTTQNGARPAPASADAPPNGTRPTPTADAPPNGTRPTPTADAPSNGTQPAPPAVAPSNGGAPAASADDPLAPILRTPSRIETLVSDRMVQSRSEIPEFTASVEIDMGPAMRMRGDLKAVGAPGGGGRTPSVNDLFVKACALALVDHPRIRSAWTDDGVLQHERIDIGVAVATDDGGLVVPVVRGADRSGLAALAASTRELTGRARKGRITPAEMSGATFSISNLGAMGISHFTAIIGPGQGAILAVGATIDRFVPVDGQPVLRPICTVTLSSDHRVIYGAHAASFLERLRAILEHPGALAF
jgi:pyruvate dehydrogenase E2 component (dihydrolipoamide acetyltransferase)